MNKNIIIALILVAIAAAAYVFLMQEDTTPPATTETATTTETTETENADYVGMSVADAQAKAEAEDVMFRVVEEDGEELATTKDYRPGRINATVESGVVTGYTVEGSEEPASDDTAETDPANHDEIIGMTVADAEAYAETNNVNFRTGSIDGEAMAVTMDYQPGRITADIVDGVVVDYSVE